MNDLRFALRQLLKNPGFTAVAVVTLALGIGANTAIFSIISGVLLKPLAYHDPERIVTLLHGGQRPVAPADYLDWQIQNQSFDTMAAAELWGGILTGGDRPQDIPGIRFGEGMFQLLGVPPLLGRTFQADDFEPGRGHVVVLSHTLWQQRFGGDRSVIGRSLTINGESYTVLGVMPPQFRFAPFWATKAEMAAPLDLAARAASRDGSSLRVFGRLKPGVSVERAQTEMNTICHRLELAYPDTNTGRIVQVDPLLENVVGDLRQGLLILAGAVGFVLLIACANVANLLLIRASAREKEMAIRTALGASRWRTIRQLLTESIVLAAIAGAVGLAVGYGGVFAMKGWLDQMPRGAEIVADSSVLWFTLGVALLTGVVFGLAPALQSVRAGLHASLKDNGRGTTEGRSGRRMRSALVVAEIALALVLLTGAGLMLRSYGRLSGLDPGFNPKNLLAIQVSLRGQPEMIGKRREAFYRQLFESVEALPGVVSASAINHLPLDGDLWSLDLFVEGRRLPEPGQGINPAYRVCRPAYFGTMNIPVLRGREFNAQDREGGPLVAIINERLASRQWPGADPVGQRITLDDPGSNPQWRTIVGVVKDVKQRSWSEPAGDEVYLPFAQSPFQSDAADHFSLMTLVIRSATDPSGLARKVQDAATSLNGQAVVSAGATMEQVVANTLSQPRFNLVLIGLFAGLALVLGAVGIYGVMAYSVSQRTQEIGIRMALGANPTDVTHLVLLQGMRPAGIGIGIGVLGSFAVSRLLQSQLFEINAIDPVTLFGVSVILGLVAALACWVPARRAAKVDPMVALRRE